MGCTVPGGQKWPGWQEPNGPVRPKAMHVKPASHGRHSCTDGTPCTYTGQSSATKKAIEATVTNTARKTDRGVAVRAQWAELRGNGPSGAVCARRAGGTLRGVHQSLRAGVSPCWAWELEGIDSPQWAEVPSWTLVRCDGAAWAVEALRVQGYAQEVSRQRGERRAQRKGSERQSPPCNPHSWMSHRHQWHY